MWRNAGVGVENWQVSAICHLPCGARLPGGGLGELKGGQQQARLLQEDHVGSTRSAGLPAYISPGQRTSFLDHVRLVRQGGAGDTDKKRSQRAEQDGRVRIHLVLYKGIKL